MSCALQRACAKANIGTSNNGVPTYKIRSRQLLRIHRLRFGTLTGTAGTVWGRENALTCCIGVGRIGSLKRAEKSTPQRLSLQLPRFYRIAAPTWRCHEYVSRGRDIRSGTEPAQHAAVRVAP